MQPLIEFTNELNVLKERAYTEGLTIGDCAFLRKRIKQIDTFRRETLDAHKKYTNNNGAVIYDPTASIEDKQKYLAASKEMLLCVDEITTLKDGFKTLHDELRQVMPTTSLVQFLYDNCSLLELVLTNNPESKTKMFNLDGYLFSCEQHVDKHPSMGLSNHKRHGRCLKCNWQFNLLSYLMERERLTKQEAICLLSKIFLIDIKNNDFAEDGLVEKYKETIRNPKYRQLIERGFARTSEKDQCFERDYALRTFQNDLYQIERIGSGEPLAYVHQEIPKDKRFIITPKQ